MSTIGYWSDPRFNDSIDSEDNSQTDDASTIISAILSNASSSNIQQQNDAADALARRATMPVPLRNGALLKAQQASFDIPSDPSPIQIRPAGISDTEIPFVFAFQQYSSIDTPVQWYSSEKKMINDAVNGRVILPVTPENFTVQSSNEQVDVVSITGINYTHAGPVGLAEVDIEGFFPWFDSLNFPSYVHPYVNRYGFFDPLTLSTMFTKAMNSGQPIFFTVSDPRSNAAVQPSMVVTVTNFQWEMRHGYGKDRFVTITLREWVPQLIWSGGFGPTAYTTITVGHKFKKKTVPRALGKIADLVYGVTNPKTADWSKIYSLNRAKIDKLIKTHKTSGSKTGPYLLLPVGTTLRVPA